MMFFGDVKKMTEDEKIEMIMVLQSALGSEADIRDLYEARCQIQSDLIFNINQIHLREDARNQAWKKYNELRTKMIMKYREPQDIGARAVSEEGENADESK